MIWEILGNTCSIPQSYPTVENFFSVSAKENAEPPPTLPSQRSLNGSTVTPDDTVTRSTYTDVGASRDNFYHLHHLELKGS